MRIISQIYNFKILKETLIFFLTFFILTAVFFSCSGKGDSRVLDKKEFIKIYSEILMISADLKVTDSIRKNRIDSIYKKNNISEKNFRNTIEKYNKNVDEWKEIYKEIIAEMEKPKLNTNTK